MSFSYVFGNADVVIQCGLLLLSLVFAVIGCFSQDRVKVKRFFGLALITIILYLLFMQFEIFAYNIGSNWTHSY